MTTEKHPWLFRWEMVMKTKKELRKEILQLRDTLTIEERIEKSHRIAEQICQMREFIEVDKVLLFASYKSEVDTSLIFETAQGLSKDIYYPKVIGKEMEFYQVQKKEDLIEGYRGICEPEAMSEKQFVPKEEEQIFILMPGAVFDVDGNRIGYGGGYYDKFLKRIETFCFYKVGIGFACQVIEIEEFPKEEHDVTLDVLVTETDCYEYK